MQKAVHSRTLHAILEFVQSVCVLVGICVTFFHSASGMPEARRPVVRCYQAGIARDNMLKFLNDSCRV